MRQLPSLAATIALAGLWACAPRVREVDCSASADACDAVDAQTAGVPRLYVDPPFGVAFSCVLLGCDTTATLRLENRGGGYLKLPAVRLAVDASVEFSLSFSRPAGDALERPTPTAQYSLGPGEAVLAHVTYRPTDGSSDSTYLQIDWYDGSQDYEKAAIERVELPVVARVLGAAHASLAEPQLSFGYVAVGEEVEAAVQIDNVSTTDGILEVVAATFTADSPSVFYVPPGFNPRANPGDHVLVPVRFVPTSAEPYFGTLVLGTNDPDTPTQMVTVSGTAIEEAQVTVLDPDADALDFGHVFYGNELRDSVLLRNDGGTAAEVVVSVTGGGYSLGGPSSFTIEPLAEAVVPVVLRGTASGEKSGLLQASWQGGTQTVALHGFCDAPEITASPTSLSFGQLALGWTSDTQRITIKNNGTGELVITNIAFEVGSSSQVAVADTVALPLSVSPGDPAVEIPVWVRADHQGNIDATLLIDSNAVDAATLRVPISASVVSCAEACPVENGTPACNSGSCAIGSCSSGWYDSDGELSNGCECQAERGGNDIGGTCSNGLKVGTLGDDCTSWPHEVIKTGTLHALNDVDLYYFETVDGGGFCDPFTDSAQVRVELLNAPPGLVFCVNDQQAGSGCGGYTSYYDPDICRTDKYIRDGSYGADDNRDVTVWVLWKPGSAPVCGNYQLKFRGRE